MDIIRGTDIPLNPWLFGRLGPNNIQVQNKTIKPTADIESPSSPSDTQPQLHDKKLSQEIVENSANCSDYQRWIDSALRLEVIAGGVVEGEEVESWNQCPNIICRMFDYLLVETDEDEEFIAEVE